MANRPDNALNFNAANEATDSTELVIADADFEVFLRQQYVGLVQFLRHRTGTAQDAEDAAQESMTRLLRYKSLEPESSWKPLLYRIATNVAHDQGRIAASRFERQHVSIELQEVFAEQRNPEEQASHEQQLANLSKAILELPPKCQKVYLLKRIHDLPHAEIARRCAISVKMVEKHLANALIHLRRKVGECSQDPSQRL